MPPVLDHASDVEPGADDVVDGPPEVLSRVVELVGGAGSVLVAPVVVDAKVSTAGVQPAANVEHPNSVSSPCFT